MKKTLSPSQEAELIHKSKIYCDECGVRLHLSELTYDQRSRVFDHLLNNEEVGLIVYVDQCRYCEYLERDVQGWRNAPLRYRLLKESQGQEGEIDQ